MSRQNTRKSYEGRQYRGGRQEKHPNLIKTPTGYQNKHGVNFTEQEKTALVNAVNRANYKRKKMLQAEAKLPRTVRGKPTGDTIGSLQFMGSESDFILAKKSKSLHRFRSRKEYESYMRNLERVNNPNYIDERVRQYKRNHMKAIENAFGDQAKDVVMKIRMMKRDEYMKMVQSEEFLEIGYLYTGEELAGRLNQIRASLGMKLKDDDYYDE